MSPTSAEGNLPFLLRVDLATVSHGASKIYWILSMTAAEAVSLSEDVARGSAGEGVGRIGVTGTTFSEGGSTKGEGRSRLLGTRLLG